MQIKQLSNLKIDEYLLRLIKTIYENMNVVFNDNDYTKNRGCAENKIYLEIEEKLLNLIVVIK